MLNVYGLGPEAIDYPVAATEMAKATNGLYTPVRRAGDIVALLSGVSFANVEDVVAVNLTLMEWAGPNDILLAPDGSFTGFVPVRAGRESHPRVRARQRRHARLDGVRPAVRAAGHDRSSSSRPSASASAQRTKEIQLRLERDKQEAFRKQERERTLEIGVDKQRRPQSAPAPTPPAPPGPAH